MSQAFLVLAVTVLLPTALMVPIRRAGRVVFLLIGLIFAVGIGYVMELGGPDSPFLALPFLGLALSLSAILAELIAIAWAAAKRRKAAHG